MTITSLQLRQDFSEFADASRFTEPSLDYYINLAYLLMDAGRWSTLLDTGAELFVAHNISLEARAQEESAAGGMPGGMVGPINSSSVDKVSVGYDTGSGIEANAGHWNLTVYGTRFVRLARMLGAGPIQIGIGYVPSGSGQAWAGPSLYPY